MDAISQPVQPGRFDPIALAEDANQQQELFGARVFEPDDVDLLRGARRYAHTGTTVARDERRAAAIGCAKLLGWSNRKVSRVMHCDVRVVGLVVQELEQSGKLPALKDRLMRAVGEAAETTVERLHELLQQDGALDPEIAGLVKSLWVGAGIGADKLAAPAPQLHLHQHVHQASGIDAAREYADRLARAKLGAPADSVSTGVPVNGVKTGGTVVDVAATVRPELGATAGQEVAATGDRATAGQPIEMGARVGTAGAEAGGGGGSRAIDGARHGDGLPRGDFIDNGGSR